MTDGRRGRHNRERRLLYAIGFRIYVIHAVNLIVAMANVAKIYPRCTPVYAAKTQDGPFGQEERGRLKEGREAYKSSEAVYTNASNKVEGLIVELRVRKA